MTHGALSSQHLDDTTLNKIIDFTYQKSGIVIKSNRKTMVANRLRSRIKLLGIETFDDYWGLLTREEKEEEQKEFYHFLDAISTNETYFQRSAAHYDIVEEHVLPELMQTLRRQLLFWSCGSSTGEETYDLAMLADRAESTFHLSIRVIGTDISQKALKHARKAQYADRRIKKLTPQQIEKYFDPIAPEKSNIPFAKETLQVKEELKKRVTFQYHNLLDDAYITNVDLIFCRNVMIYFDAATQQGIIDRFEKVLNPGGFLIIGHSESLQSFHTNLKSVRLPKATIYKKEELRP